MNRIRVRVSTCPLSKQLAVVSVGCLVAECAVAPRNGKSRFSLRPVPGMHCRVSDRQPKAGVPCRSSTNARL